MRHDYQVTGGYLKGRIRREDIITTAAAVYAEAGYHGSSLREIARRVGITHAGLLYYFPTKESLLTAVLERRDAEDAEREQLSAPPGLEALRHLVALAEHNVRHPGIVDLYARLAAEAVAADHPAHDYFERHYRLARDVRGRLVPRAGRAGRTARRRRPRARRPEPGRGDGRPAGAVAVQPRRGGPGRRPALPPAGPADRPAGARGSGRTGSQSAGRAGGTSAVLCTTTGRPSVDRLLDGLHRVEHVVGELARGPFRHPGPDRPGQLQHAGAARGRVPCAASSSRLAAGRADAAASGRRNGSDPGVRRCRACRRSRGWSAGSAESKVSTTCAEPPRLELQQRRHGGGHGDRELRTGARAGADDPGLAGPAAGAR